MIPGSPDYFRKRFSERIYENPVFSQFLETLDEEDADKAVNFLVEGLLIEIDVY